LDQLDKFDKFVKFDHLNRLDYLSQKIANGLQITSGYHENNDTGVHKFWRQPHWLS
jgi:hypothetical protein